MTRLQGSARRTLRLVARLGAVVSASMLVISVVSAMPAGAVLPGGAAPTAGQEILASNNTTPITDGVQDTPFVLSYTGDSACAGDSSTGGYRVNTFMVPASVDVSQLEYTASGPTAPTGVTLALPLFAQTGNARQVNKNTAPTTGIITAGNLVQPLSFAALAAGGIAVPNGDYKIGAACTVLGVTEEYWQTTITVTGSTTTPVTFAWQVTANPTTTTTTTTAATTTTTTTAATTTTTIPRSTTTTSTTVGTSTSTTAAPAVTTTTIPIVGFTPTPSVGSQSPTSGGTFPVTGSSSLPVVIWAVLLLVFGRMAILLARPVKVVPVRSR